MLKISQLKIERDRKLLSYDFQLKEGNILAIQGLSGVGKSTLLSAIAGFVEPCAGSIFWQGDCLNVLPVEQRPVSYLFQDHNLFEHLSVIDNMSLGFVGIAPKAQIMEAAEVLQVADQLVKKPGALSGGQRQRVALIRTMLRPEPLILLDEPFAELDPKTRALATNWVRDTAKQHGKTVLMVTHESEDVARVADECLVLATAQDSL